MACAQAQAWREEGVVDDDFCVGVNLSARQLDDPALPGAQLALCSTPGFPHRR